MEDRSPLSTVPRLAVERLVSLACADRVRLEERVDVGEQRQLPHRPALSWEIAADWQHDQNLKTEVEIRFVAESTDGTRVELAHRHLDRYGALRDEMRGIFDSEGGWNLLLPSFAHAAAA